jgi:CspA family cold shock protein
LDFACFGFVRFATFLRAGLALALPRFELFLRDATRFFALAMAVSCEVCRRQANLGASQLYRHYLSAIRHATVIPHPRMMPCAIDMMTIPDGATGRRRWRVISAVEQAGLCGLNEGQVVEYGEVANKGKTSAQNREVQR